MKIIFIFLCLFTWGLTLAAQESKSETETPKIVNAQLTQQIQVLSTLLEWYKIQFVNCMDKQVLDSAVKAPNIKETEVKESKKNASPTNSNP